MKAKKKRRKRSAFALGVERGIKRAAVSARSRIKKSFVIEEALRNHLAALNEIPEDYIIPPVVRVSAASMRAVADLLESPPPPTPEMQRLMRGQ